MWSRGHVIPGVDAIALAGGRIVAVGRADELDGLRGAATRVIDAAGATVTPGITDAHLHLLHWARVRGELDLAGAAAPREVAACVARHAAAHTTASPLLGRGWDAANWPERPHRAVLDAVCADRPVLLYSHDLHNLWVNSAALRAAGIGHDTANPEGGWIERDAAGAATGLLREHAMRLATPLERALAGALPAQLADAVRALHALGVTAVHDFEGAEAHRLLRATAHGTGPRLRVLMNLPHAHLESAIELGLGSGLGDLWFRTGSLKLFADGTLGSRTAALLAPYDDGAGTGEDLLAPEALRAIVARASSHGWSVAVHAIGDRAVRSALDAFAASHPALSALPVPPRIEHAQLVAAADVARFAALGVVASMQPLHCVADIPAGRRAWASRRDLTYPWHSLLDSGARLAFGSDAPVEPPSVALGLHAALARRPVGDAEAWAPGQAIGLDAALTAYTESPARIAGSWPETGTLDPGAVADLVVWGQDLHALEPDGVAAAAPVMTISGGEIVFEAPVHAGAAAAAGRAR